MANHIVDQYARYLILGSVFSDEIPMMPECKSYRNVDDSICPDDNYNAMVGMEFPHPKSMRNPFSCSGRDVSVCGHSPRMCQPQVERMA
jgi:hypothetical protein